VNENVETFTVKDGAIVAHGPRSHCFYVGGFYIDTEYQDQGFPLKGFEVQVKDPRKTGSLYQVKDNGDDVAKDNQGSPNTSWPKATPLRSKWTTNRWCSGPSPRTAAETGGFPARRIGPGTIALQGHDAGSTVYYKNIRIKLLE
jgi:hypothetical protein